MLRGLRLRWRLRGMHLEEPYRTIYPFTQVHPERQQNLARMSRIIEEEQIPGAVVECGVLDGGTAGLMSLLTAGSKRAVHLFDAWRGMPESTLEDGEEGKIWVGQIVGSPKRVARLMEKLGIDSNRVHYHVGWFHETFPHVDIPQIALLHVDCDFHDPVKLCLDRWYDHVVPGGFIQFDDYSAFQGCRIAVNQFLASHPELQLEQAGPSKLTYFLRKP